MVSASDENRESFLSKLESWGRNVVPWCALLLVLVLGLGQSSLKPFGYDEFVTLHIARLPSAASIIGFFNSGKDTTSYLPALLVQAMAFVPGRVEVLARLPFVLAYALTCLCIYAFIARRYSTGYALAGLAFFVSGYSFAHIANIRAYSFLMLGSAFAALCWQRAGMRERHRLPMVAGVFAGLVTAIAFHVFAVFLFVPFAVAEWVRQRKTPDRSKAMWVALSSFPLAGFIFLPSLIAARKIYANTFWSPPTLDSLLEIYRVAFDAMVIVAPVLILLIAVAVWLRYSGRLTAITRSEGEDGEETAGFTAEEWTLCLGFCFLPQIAFAGVAKFGVYRPDYVMPFFIGLTLVSAALFATLLRCSRWAGWGLGLTLLLVLLAQDRYALTQGLRVVAGRKPTRMRPVEYQKEWWDAVAGMPLPVVAASGFTLMDLQYHGPPELTARLVYLTSHGRALTVPMSVTTELNMEIFGPELHLPTEDYDKFVAEHRRFLMVMNPNDVEFCWLYNWLIAAGERKQDVRLTLLWGDGTSPGQDSVYLVELN